MDNGVKGFFQLCEGNKKKGNNFMAVYELNLNSLNGTDYQTIYNQTVSDMKTLGIYKTEFIPIISRYAELRVQYLIIMDKWYSTGCVITEEYTNKAGATNVRKTALYQAVENLRKELTETESILGLTPSGLKKINDKSMAIPKKSILSEALKSIETT